ncbi:PHA/PHB synthase family protein [Candidatus Fokinia crypta]|uniref:Poly(3-hydroxyalkanoate) synthetase n=1 Tax=Candidatus Fokinia crypta TaxID=1920990 RepID=A0ABZ0UPN7_9RICK|nr:alpha/beta fold hydrolase [Candidatus Fokinia cryptica]WPX98095.1 Poly(3-hydroxyalkanoate) synthetase [Candidatus Fokinia cryptica]
MFFLQNSLKSLENCCNISTLQNNLYQSSLLYSYALVKLLTKLSKNSLMMDIGGVFYEKFIAINGKFWMIPENVAFYSSQLHPHVHGYVSESYKYFLEHYLNAYNSPFNTSNFAKDNNSKASKDILEAYDKISNSIVKTVENYENLQKCSNAVHSITLQELRFLKFCYKQTILTFRPTNFISYNQEILESIASTLGENLKNGAKNLLHDIEKYDNFWVQISTVPDEAFKVGENIAYTKGVVVFKNRMFELLRYYPKTETVFTVPILICTAWINKYYILDLQEKNSFVSYLVEQGHTVFVISWVNPDASYRDVDLEDYIKDGAIEAINKVKEITGQVKINLIGYCLGGIISAIIASYMEVKLNNPINSLILLTTLLDFSDSGEVSVFIDNQILDKLEKHMDEKGYLDGNAMFSTFSILKANDMLWYYYINNYMLGKQPSAFDILYWNADCTRLPFKMHKSYLRHFYQNNELIKGTYSCMGSTIDINKISVPVYNLAAKEDHIAPWKAIHKTHLLCSNNAMSRFVLTESGHVAGIVNPPYKKKYGYFVCDKYHSDPDFWNKSATKFNCSWWTHLAEWLNENKLSGEKAKSESIDEINKLKICCTPGTYVQQK